MFPFKRQKRADLPLPKTDPIVANVLLLAVKCPDKWAFNDMSWPTIGRFKDDAIRVSLSESRVQIMIDGKWWAPSLFDQECMRIKFRELHTRWRKTKLDEMVQITARITRQHIRQGMMPVEAYLP